MSDRIYPDEHLPVMASSNNPPAGTPNAVRKVEYPCTCSANERSGVAPPSPFCPLHGTHPITPTPNAVEEARTMYKVVCQHCQRVTIVPQNTIAAVRAEEREKMEVEANAILYAEGRTQAFADVRRVVEGMSDTDDYGYASCPTRALLAALDALASEGK